MYPGPTVTEDSAITVGSVPLTKPLVLAWKISVSLQRITVWSCRFRFSFYFPMMASFVTKLFRYFAKLGAIYTIVFEPCRAFETTNNASFWLPLLSTNMTCTNNGNNITGGHIPCTYTPQYAMSTAGSSDNFRNIISYNSNGYASLGFEQVRTGAFCLSIYWFYPSKCLL